jgi:hypothetical protein
MGGGGRGGGLSLNRPIVRRGELTRVWVILLYVTDGNIMYLTDASRFLISCAIQHYAPVVG